MHIKFPEKNEKAIKQAVADGYYMNETELVRDAVRRLLQDLAPKQSPLYQAVMKGDAAIKRGDTKPLTKELMDEIFESAMRKAKNNEPYSSPDAIP